MKRAELIENIRSKKSFLCVGLDPDMSRIPLHLHRLEDPVFAFNKQIIDATHDLCVAYKPNIAFYEALGLSGLRSLSKTIDYLYAMGSHFVIADAKRGDIGNTSAKYAQAFLEQWPCDAITVAPYMGSDSVEPFLRVPDKWIALLVLTSNIGNQDFQQLELSNGRMLWEQTLLTAQKWGSPENLMFVIGATQPEAFKRVREIATDHFLLVPGVGAQGGNLDNVCQHALNKDIGLLVNSSRGILYAANEIDFADAARSAAQELQSVMKEYV